MQNLFEFCAVDGRKKDFSSPMYLTKAIKTKLPLNFKLKNANVRNKSQTP